MSEKEGREEKEGGKGGRDGGRAKEDGVVSTDSGSSRRPAGCVLAPLPLLRASSSTFRL